MSSKNPPNEIRTDKFHQEMTEGTTKQPTTPIESLVDESGNIPERVFCANCGTRHFSDEQTFFTIYGNVMVGLYGGIIGNNFDSEGRVGRLTFICRKRGCLEAMLGRWTFDGNEEESEDPIDKIRETEGGR